MKKATLYIFEIRLVCQELEGIQCLLLGIRRKRFVASQYLGGVVKDVSKVSKHNEKVFLKQSEYI